MIKRRSKRKAKKQTKKKISAGKFSTFYSLALWPFFFSNFYLRFFTNKISPNLRLGLGNRHQTSLTKNFICLEGMADLYVPNSPLIVSLQSLFMRLEEHLGFKPFITLSKIINWS